MSRKKKYQLAVMSFDGDYKIETPTFETMKDVWEYSDNIGSKWFFFPFHFVVSGKRIVEVPVDLLFFSEGLTLNQLGELFKENSEKPEMQGVDMDAFLLGFYPEE